MMKISLIRTVLVITFLLFPRFFLAGQDSLTYSMGFTISRDLSDTFDGGTMFSGDIILTKSWFGSGVTYGHFLSHSKYEYLIIIENSDISFSIPFDELSIMQCGSLFGIITPIKSKWFKLDFQLGLALGKSKSSIFKGVSYIYDSNAKTITSVERDYQLIKRNHFGCQLGLDLSFFETKKVGFKLNTKFQDLSNGGTFFFVGGGLCFKL